MTQNTTWLLGVNYFYGEKQTEYGGFLIQDTAYNTNAASNAYVQLTYYF
jgi:hypothetical protein